MTKQLKAFAAGLVVVSLAGLGALGVTFGTPDFAQKDKGFLAGLISQALSSPGMQVSVGGDRRRLVIGCDNPRRRHCRQGRALADA
jgi:hypothetical protein